MKHLSLAGAVASVFLAGCAGAVGPPLGLGPEGDAMATILILAVVLAIAYRPTRKSIIHRLRGSQSDSARQIVKERYARGEIGEDEYQRITRQISCS